MIRLIFYISLIITQFLSNKYINAYRFGLLGQDVFSPYASQVIPSTANIYGVEGKYISMDLKDSVTLYKINSSVNFTEFDTITIEYFIENGQGQLLLLNTNNEITMYTVLDTLTEQNKWISYTYKIPSCSDFNTLAFKNINKFKMNLKSITLSNTKKMDFITSKISNDISSWSWGISDIENMDGYMHIQSIGQWCALSVHYDKTAFAHDYVEFEIMQNDFYMGLTASTENCGDYDYMLNEITPEKNGDWYKYHIDLTKLITPSCNINRFSFMNRKEEPQELSIKNMYTGTNISDDTEIVNKDKQYECEELLGMTPFFFNEDEVNWINLSENVDHILYQPNRLIVYDINPDGYISYKSPEEFQSPLFFEMDVLSSYPHWTLELIDSSGNIINKLIIDNDQLSMKSWTTIKQGFENKTGKDDIIESFKLYHDSMKSENIVIRNLYFHPYNPPIESGIAGDESCCEVKYCVCEVIYETIYIDEDEEIPTDADIVYDFEKNNEVEKDETKEKENDKDSNNNNNNKEGDIQKRSLFNRIGSFLNSLNI